jgi:serine protease Do
MERSVRRLLVPAVLVGLTLPWAAWADSNKKPAERSPSTDAKKQDVTPQAYLGIGIEALHPSFATHLPDMLISGQGVLVRAVMPDSPAAKAGVKQDDILITYDDQKLFSPEQLAKLVMSDKSHRDVNLGIVRQGQVEHLRVTLGEHERQAALEPTAHRNPFVPWWGRDRALPQWHDRWSDGRTNTTAETPMPDERFESLSLKKVDDQHFQLELKFTDKDGKMQTRDLAGTRDDIRKKIEADKSIPKDERQYVLRALGSPGHPLALSPWEQSEEGGLSNTSSAYDAFSWFDWPLVPMDF